MHSIRIKNKKRKLPEAWEDLTHKQVMSIIPFLFNPTMSQKDIEECTLFTLLAIDKKTFLKINVIQQAQLISLIEFLFEESTSPVVKEFTHNGIKYIAPATRLNNISVIEFAMADAYFGAIHYETADLNAYNKIIATLYRPEKKNLDRQDPEYNGDPREKYNTVLAEERAETFTDLNPFVKISIIKFFIACKNKIAEDYSILFEKPKEVKEGEPEPEPKKSNDIVPAWIGIVYDLSQQGIFGNFEQAAYTNFHTVCIHLCREAIKAKELETNSIFKK